MLNPVEWYIIHAKTHDHLLTVDDAPKGSTQHAQKLPPYTGSFKALFIIATRFEQIPITPYKATYQVDSSPHPLLR